MVQNSRTQQVWAALGSVTDPEIDESVTSLEFVTSVRIESGNRVHIEFRLPTYWCAPNFAFLMASDMRDAVAELPWVENVTVGLLDHFSAEMINRSVALRQDFRDAFPGETDGDLSEIRKKFLGKAFERRQELLVEALRTVDGMGGDRELFPDPTDRASLEGDRNLLLRIRDRERKLITKIDEALGRIDDGSYGRCEECGGDISIDRLKERPVTTLCIDCKSLQEAEERRLKGL